MEKIRKDGVITAISVYSSRISCCIATLDKDGNPYIIGLGKSEGKFLGGKGILDIEALSKGIRDSLKIAQNEAALETTRAFISISGGSISSEKSRGLIKLSERGGEISNKNIRDVLKIANTIPINVAKEVMHSIPQDFIVDGQDEIENPIGLNAVKLETETLLITVHQPFLYNIVKSLNLSGIELEEVVFSGIAASYCLLSRDTAERGTVLMEIDNAFTALSAFYNNVLRGVYIHHKSVIADGTLESLKENVDRIRSNKPISKIILAGAGYIHEDFIEKIDSVFGIPSHMAYVRNIKGSARDIANPTHLTSIGLALYGFEKRRDNIAERKKKSVILGKVTRRVGEFLDEYF